MSEVQVTHKTEGRVLSKDGLASSNLVGQGQCRGGETGDARNQAVAAVSLLFSTRFLQVSSEKSFASTCLSCVICCTDVLGRESTKSWIGLYSSKKIEMNVGGTLKI